MDKAFILSEIKRTAINNEPLGHSRFQQETGITKHFIEKYWGSGGITAAQKEAGFAPNELAVAHDHKFLMDCIASLIRELGKFPAKSDLKRKRNQDPSFPSAEAYFRRFGSIEKVTAQVLEFCRGKEGYNDVIERCVASSTKIKSEEPKAGLSEAKSGHVYLFKSARRYKIGKSFDLDRRESELGPQSPYGVSRIHKIRTDDPSGVEAYWHRRFAIKRKRGEWFELTASDVEAFKRWRNIY